MAAWIRAQGQYRQMEFWGQFVSSILGAFVGGGIAALVAWRVFSAERESRKRERAEAEAESRRARVRRGLERQSELLQEMLASVPTDAGVNAPSFSAQRFAFATQGLAFDLPRSQYAEVEAWVNGLLARYVLMTREARLGRVSAADIGDLISLSQQRLQMWFLQEAPVEDFALTDTAFAQKYPQVLDYPQHADSPPKS